MTITPAGWYQDPAQPNQRTALRWWDGTRWTEATTTAPAATPVQPAQPAPAQPTLAGQDPWQPNPAQPQAYPAQPDPWQPNPAQPQAYPAQSATSSGGYGYPPAASGYPPAASGYPPAAPAYAVAGPPTKATTTPDGVQLAGLGNRLVARIIDGLLLAVVQLLLGAPLYLGFIHRFVDYVKTYDQQVRDGLQPNPMSMYTETGFIPVVIGLTVISLVVSAGYTVTLIHVRGATLGKSLAGVRVRSWDHEGNPTWAQAWKRWLSGEAAGLVVSMYGLVNELWPLWDARKQALHDKWPATVVVSGRSTPA